MILKILPLLQAERIRFHWGKERRPNVHPTPFLMPVFGDLMPQEIWGAMTLECQCFYPDGGPSISSPNHKDHFSDGSCEGTCKNSHSSMKKRILSDDLGERAEKGLLIRWCQHILVQDQEKKDNHSQRR